MRQRSTTIAVRRRWPSCVDPRTESTSEEPVLGDTLLQGNDESMQQVIISELVGRGRKCTTGDHFRGLRLPATHLLLPEHKI